MVPSALKWLALGPVGRSTTVVKKRAAFCGTPVVPSVNRGFVGSVEIIETNQSSCAPTPGAFGGLYPGTLNRTDQRQLGGTVARFTTFIVKTMLSAAPVVGLLIGSAIETEVMSCCACPSV